MERGFDAFSICTSYTLKEIEKQINEMQIDHEYLNSDAKIKIKVEPEPKTVCFDGYSEKQFNVSLYILYE
ncbi:MAG TPA: hypothetical protein VIM42_04775 [Clostridium sp.]